MGKRIFVLIVVLMSISLIGIISVQLYWINNAIESKDAQFDNDVIKAMARASERLKVKELEAYRDKIKPIFDQKEFLNKAEIKNFLIQQIDTVNRKRFSFGSTIVEEDFKVPLDILNENPFLNNDSIILKRFTRRSDIFTAQILTDDESLESFDETRYSKKSMFDEWTDTKIIDDLYREYQNEYPIHKRISNREINNTLREELQRNNIDIDFKYGVYNNKLATKLKSGYFTIDPEKSYRYPLFEDENGNSYFTLYIDFPEKSKHILSDISYILLLSLFFIFIIIVAFSSSLYQLVKQKKISEIKTDFINNMTHEFKTPIATINLALDSIKNPKILKDEEKVLRYIKMIRDENKRMHGQVENVLRISRLEKNQVEINKDAVDLHDVIEDAVSHVHLLVLDKKGTITTHLNAIQSEVLANQFHMTNVLVNMLENAAKYSVDPPKIDLYTESTNKYLIIKIKDEGIGMSKQAQKHVFDKFYREQKGNIHDVKGHGLGLAYVKEIVENHHGTVFVESEKGKGSIFTIKLPII
jgi:two-component system phosphate regulon sensor histidine kinase PhoR